MLTFTVTALTATPARTDDDDNTYRWNVTFAGARGTIQFEGATADELKTFTPGALFTVVMEPDEK